MKRILILTAGFGEGHNSAARGIREGLLADRAPGRIAGRSPRSFRRYLRAGERLCPRSLPRHDQQCAARLARRFIAGSIARKDFAGNFKAFFTLKKDAARLLGRFEPDVIVSVYPAYPHMLDEMLGRAGKCAARKRVVVITDSLSRERDLVPLQRRLFSAAERAKAPPFSIAPAFRRSKQGRSVFR